MHPCGPVAQLQAILDVSPETVDVKGKPAPTVASELVDAERLLLQSRGLLKAQGKILPRLIEELGGRFVHTPEFGVAK